MRGRAGSYCSAQQRETLAAGVSRDGAELRSSSQSLVMAVNGVLMRRWVVPKSTITEVSSSTATTRPRPCLS